MEGQTFLVSDETKNSYGFRVSTAGIDTTQFERNPIMLFMHERKNNVIGKWDNLKKDSDKMYASAIFDTNDPLGKLIADKVKNGFIKSASLGLEILEQKGDLVTKSRLHEISIVDIGSNKNALKLKLYNKKEIKKLYFNLNRDSMSLLESLIALLGLQTDASEEDILKKVEELTIQEQSQLDNQKEEKQKMLNLAVAEGRITADMLPQFGKLLDLDFTGTTQLLSKMRKKVNLADYVQNLGGAKNNPSGKSKSTWNLEDYRKFAPYELERDPVLYQRLLEEILNH